MTVSPARRAAYEVLLRVFEQDAYADRAFRSAAEGLDDRERAFAQRLAYGSVQRVRMLDHAIERYDQATYSERQTSASRTGRDSRGLGRRIATTTTSASMTSAPQYQVSAS